MTARGRQQREHQENMAESDEHDATVTNRSAQVNLSHFRGGRSKANDKVARAVNRPVGFEEPG